MRTLRQTGGCQQRGDCHNHHLVLRKTHESRKQGKKENSKEENREEKIIR